MPAQLDAYKVKDLVSQYKANPTMFSDDQLDKLEQMAEENEIEFKRQHSDFSLTRALQQASAGFVEGFTTFDLMPKEPRNTGEAIFRQLGHLAGFAPSILKAPVVGLAKAIALGTGRKTKDVLEHKVAQSVMKAIDFVGPKSVPMIVSHKAQNLFNKGVTKTGADALEYMKRGSSIRAIAEEAVGLGAASAVSSIWKGPDAIMDSFIGGAIAGGAFGGIGNFANIARYHKGTPEQVAKANKILRTGLGAAVTGLPATLRGEPTEMQIYEYLLGGFFGSNTRPAREQFAQKWFTDPDRFSDRKGSYQILDPRQDKNWKSVSKEAQDYIMYDHPMPKDSLVFKNSGKFGGTTGQALGWLEYNLPEVNWPAKAIETLEYYGGREPTENEMRDWFGGQASHIYSTERRMMDKVNKAVKEAVAFNDDQISDFNDPIEVIESSVKDIASKLYNDKKSYDSKIVTSESQIAKILSDAKRNHSKVNDGIPHPKRFIDEVSTKLTLNDKQERELSRFFVIKGQPEQSQFALTSKGKAGERNYALINGKGLTIGSGEKTVALGEPYYDMPINRLSKGGFQILTHYEENGNANRIFKNFVNAEEGRIQFTLDAESENALHHELWNYKTGKEASPMYVFSGIKDKGQLMIAPIITKLDGVQVTKENIFDAMSVGDVSIRADLERAFEFSRKKSTMTGKDANTMHEQIYISNILHHAQMHNLTKDGEGLRGLGKVLGVSTNVADFNKRMQLLGNKMVPLDPESFLETHPDGMFKVIYVNDSDMYNHKSMNGESNVDGGQIYRARVTYDALKSVGLPNATEFKPVVVGRSELGMHATKSNGQVASPAWEKYMASHGIDRVVFSSSLKIKGNHEPTQVDYNDKDISYSSKTPNIYKVPIQDMQVSMGTFVNMEKAIAGSEVPIQMFSQFDWENPSFANEFFSMVTEKSLAGTESGKILAAEFKHIEKKGEKGERKLPIDANALQNRMETENIDIKDLPVDFVLEHLFKLDGRTEIGALLLDKIKHLERIGELEVSDFRGGDADFSTYHELTERVKKASEGHYYTNFMMFKKENMNSLNKFIRKRWANPWVKEGGKSWLKSISPDMIASMETAESFKDGKRIEGYRPTEIKEGHVYLDNYFRGMSVVLLGKQYTLGELWEFHIGQKALPKGAEAKDVSDALELVAIRVPSDSPSGTRVLRLGGWTNQEGAGSFTHSKDDFYLGGADKDSDYIKIFQGFSKGLRDAIGKHTNDKESYRGKESHKDGKLVKSEPDNPAYLKALEAPFVDPNLGAEEKYYISGKGGGDIDPLNQQTMPKMLMFSPEMRMQVAKRAYTGLQSLGYSLSSKSYLSHMADYIKQQTIDTNTGEILPFIVKTKNKKDTVEIRVRDSEVEGHSRAQFLRDLGAMSVNKGADASSDPTIKDHAGARDMFFNEYFRVKKNGNDVKTFEEFQHLINQVDSLRAVSKSQDVVKKSSSFRRVNKEYLKQAIKDGDIKLKGREWEVTGDAIDVINAHAGERFIMDSGAQFGLAHRSTRAAPKGSADKTRIPVYRAEFIPNSTTLIDLEADLSFISKTSLGREYKGNYALQAAQNMTKLTGANFAETYANRFSRAHGQLWHHIGVIDYSDKWMDALPKKTHELVKNNLDILFEDIHLWAPSGLSEQLIHNRSYGLDLFGKQVSQFSGIELLNKKYVNIVKELNRIGAAQLKALKTKAGDKTHPDFKGVFSTKDLTKVIYQMTKNLKKAARDMDQADVENLMNAHVNRIRDKISSKGVDPALFIDYYQTMALTPMAGEKGGLLSHNKKIHGSKLIPAKVRKLYYDHLEIFTDKLYQRYQKKPIIRKFTPEGKPIKESDQTEYTVKHKNFSVMIEGVKEKISSIAPKKQAEPKVIYGIIKKKDGTPRLDSKDNHIGASYNKETRVITINKDALKKKYKDKAWTKPHVKGVYPMDKDFFKTYKKFEEFVIAHEVAHDYIKQGKNQTKADYENQINLEAGRVVELYKSDVPSIKSTLNVTEPVPKAVKIESIELTKAEYAAKSFAELPLEFMALNNRDVDAIKTHRKHINEHPVIRENYAGWFGWFTNEFSNQRPRSLKTIDVPDIHAMNKYFERVTDVNDLEFKRKYFMWDPRYVDEHLSLRNVASAFKKYTFKDPITGEHIEVVQVMAPIGAIGEFSKNVKDTGIDRDTNYLRKSSDNLFNFLDILPDKDATVREFIDWRESGKVTEPSVAVKSLDKLTTEFFTKLGDEYIYTKDSKGVRISDNKGQWKIDNKGEFDKLSKGSGVVINKYMEFDKEGKFNFKKFMKVAFDPEMQVKVRNVIGVDGLQRYKYELKVEDHLPSKPTKADRLAYRSANRHEGIGFFEPDTYIPHMNFGKTEGARAEFSESIKVVGERKYQEALELAVKKNGDKKVEMNKKYASKVRDKWLQWMHDRANFSSEFLTVKDIADLSEINDSTLHKSLEGMGMKHRIGPLEAREANLQGYDKSHIIYSDYIDKVVGGYYKTLSAIHGDQQIRVLKKMDYKPSEAEKKHFDELYQGGKKRRARRAGELPDGPTEVKLGARKRRYNNYIDVWADYIKLHLQTVLGHQTYFPEQIMYEVERGIDPLYLKDKRNLFYMTSDQNMLGLYEKLWKSKRFSKAPFIKGMMDKAPMDADARKEYFSRKIHEFGRMEAQYELMTLLANTGTWSTNIFSGNAMTLGSAGVRNFVNVFNKKKVFDRLLSVDGKPVLQTLNGKDVTDRKTLTKWMEESGIIDNFIQNEFESNPRLTDNLKKSGINMKNFRRDITIAMRGEKGVREESISEVVKRYGVKDVMLKYGSFFMRHSEQVNRVNSYMAHAMQAIEKFGPESRELSIKDDFVHEMAMKGIENTQFLYQNSFRPMFMRTATGKVLSRFKLFAWNSIRTRREFYRQAEIYGFKRDTVEFNRAKDLFLVDMFMMALGGAFMFSIFDTSLAPPYDWIQAMADWMYGDKRERDMAFFGSKLGPANLLKPPIARIPQAMGEILSGDWEKFSGYTAYTLFPFGRMARQLNQLTDDRVGHGIERAPEILARIPYNQAKSKLSKAIRNAEEQEAIDSLL